MARSDHDPRGAEKDARGAPRSVRRECACVVRVHGVAGLEVPVVPGVKDHAKHARLGVFVGDLGEEALRKRRHAPGVIRRARPRLEALVGGPRARKV